MKKDNGGNGDGGGSGHDYGDAAGDGDGVDDGDGHGDGDGVDGHHPNAQLPQNPSHSDILTFDFVCILVCDSVPPGWMWPYSGHKTNAAYTNNATLRVPTLYHFLKYVHSVNICVYICSFFHI